VAFSFPPSARDLHELLAEHASDGAHPLALRLISLTPTPHRATLSTGARVYTWCVLDTFIIAGLLGCDLRLESLPPGGSSRLTVAMTAGKIESDPGFVVSFPLARDGNGGHFTEAFCPYANLFPSTGAYDRWAPKQPRSTVPVSIERAAAIAAEFARDVVDRDAGPAACPATACGGLPASR